MEETSKKKRGWVKNAAIIFLSIMLVLTLFSNHIQNYSLPEVSTYAVNSGSISAKIRGSGAVAANDSYEVKLTQSRVVQSVGVKTGDAVEAGDVLFLLADRDSTELEEAKASLESQNIELQKALIDVSNEDYSQENVNIRRAGEDLAELIRLRDASYVPEADLAAVRNTVAAARDEVAALKKLVENIQIEIENSTEENLDVKQRLLEAQDRLIAAELELEKSETKLKELEDKRTAWEEYLQKIKEKQREIEDLNIALRKTQKTDGQSSAKANIDIGAMRKKIEETEALIQKLTSEATGTELTSPVSGIVRSVGVTSGSTVEMNVPLAVIEVVERGYSLSFPVTNEQSKKVRVGDSAEVSGYYWGGPEIKATLSNIKSDPESTNQGKILTFDILGEIESGSQLSLSIGQKSQEYETIVPNNAIREDTNGKFVLMVTVKSNALFNRHIARRVDIEVLASDDINSAVSGGLTYGDYVITNATQPIETGMQVRLAEG